MLQQQPRPPAHFARIFARRVDADHRAAVLFYWLIAADAAPRPLHLAAAARHVAGLVPASACLGQVIDAARRALAEAGDDAEAAPVLRLQAELHAASHGTAFEDCGHSRPADAGPGPGLGVGVIVLGPFS